MMLVDGSMRRGGALEGSTHEEEQDGADEEKMPMILVVFVSSLVKQIRG